MRRRWVLLVLVLVFLVTAIPAAAEHFPTTGTQISLLAPPATFPAGEPFFVRHGISCPLSSRRDCRDPDTRFELLVDGEPVPMTRDVNHSVGGVEVQGLHNFDKGLKIGTHTFTGHWYFACQLSPNTCDAGPDRLVMEVIIEVEFTQP